MDDNARITALESRLDRIERAIGLARIPTESPMPAQDAVPEHISPVVMPRSERKTRKIDYKSTKQPPPNRVHQGTLEETIGLKWAGWVGAIVFVIGAGFLISWLKVNGYFAAIPPAARVAAMALTGFALIGAGEWVYRRLDPYAAAGLYGGGAAVLLLVGYAGHGFYGLYGQAGAYVAMAGATVVGAIVATRAGMVSVGLLSILGGSLAPLLLAEGSPRPAGFFVYLATLQAVALTLAGRGHGAKWWALRVTSLLVVTAWVIATLHVAEFVQSIATTMFCLFAAAAYHAEVLASARRRALGGTGTVFNVLITGLLTTALLDLSADAGVRTQVLWLISLAGAAAVMAAACRRATTLRVHSITYLLQAAALVAVIAPIALSGQWVSIAWLCWAIALAVTGRWFDSPTTRIFPLIVWAFSVVDLFAFRGEFFARRDSIAFVIGDQAFAISAIVGMCLAVGGLLLAVLTESIDDSGGAMPIAGAAVWIAALIGGTSAEASTIGIAIFAWILAAASALTKSGRLLALSAAMLGVATLKWIVVDVLFSRLSGRAASTALLSTSALDSLTLATSVVGIYLWHRREIDRYVSSRSTHAPAVTVAATATLLLAFGATIEASRWIDRFVPAGQSGLSASQWTQLLWTGVWTIALIGFAVIAQRLDAGSEARAARHLIECGKAVILLAAKFVLFDTLRFRLWNSPGPGALFENPRFETAAIVIAAGLLFEWRASQHQEAMSSRVRSLTLLATMIVVVWAGTLEIDQSVSLWMNSQDRGHVVLSVFWAVSAVVAVVAGFVTRRSAARYFGLALLAITLTKVFVIDLSNVQTGLRILSFMGLGGLLLLTSVLYGKVSPVRREQAKSEQ